LQRSTDNVIGKTDHVARSPHWMQSLAGELTASSTVIWVRSLLVFILILLAWRALYRVVWPSYFVNVPGKDLWLVYLIGLRFDLATALGTLAIPTILLWFPWPRAFLKPVIRITLWLTVAFLVVALGFMWGDLLFFGESGHHLTCEPADTVHAVWPMLSTAFTAYPLQTLGLFVMLWLLIRAIRKQFGAVPVFEQTRWWGYPLRFLIIATLTLIGVRGGLQKEPLKVTDAIVSQYYVAANLALNGWYSFAATMFADHRDRPIKLPDVSAIESARLIVGGSHEHFETAAYPLMRRMFPADRIVGTDDPLNVVLIVVESLNATRLTTFGGRVSVMPFLDSLSQQSLIFTNCNAVATRSFRGVCAVINSVPDLGDDALAITYALPTLRGLGTILREHNYYVRFMHAAAPGSMGIEAICRMAGYNSFETSDDFPSSDQNGSWGVWDHLALERMSEEMDTLPEPFHYGMFTLCTHAPWKLPKGFVPPFAPTVPGAEMLNSYAYLDAAFRDFFAREAKSKHFKRTLYVIIGDHTTHAMEHELYRIADIFYAPGRLKGTVDTRLTGQLDILPTILDLAGIEAEHASFGKSAVDHDTAHCYAVSVQGSLLQWRRPGRTLVNDLRRDIMMFDPQSADAETRNLLQSEPELADSLRRELTAFYQTASSLVRNNRICPPNSGLP
jgi:hypothetical protein